jgi:hypothetical protein
MVAAGGGLVMRLGVEELVAGMEGPVAGCSLSVHANSAAARKAAVVSLIRANRFDSLCLNVMFESSWLYGQRQKRGSPPVQAASQVVPAMASR